MLNTLFINIISRQMRSNGRWLRVLAVRRETISWALVIAHISHLFVVGASQAVIITPLSVLLPYGLSFGAGRSRYSMTFNPIWPRRWCHRVAVAFNSRGCCECRERCTRYLVAVKAVIRGPSLAADKPYKSLCICIPPELLQLLINKLYLRS